MNGAIAWFGSESGTALLIALGHSLWMAALLLFFAGVALRGLSARRAGLRYMILLGTQTAVLAATLFVWSLLSVNSRESQNEGRTPSVSVPGEVSFAEQKDDVEAAEALSFAPPTSVRDNRPTWATMFGFVWTAGAILVLAFRLYAYGRTWRLCRGGKPILDGPWRMLLDAERRAMAMGRAVALRAVDGLRGPAAYGVFRPVILIPVSLLTGMPEEAMRAILVHELNHVRRWDPLVQALQQILEALFFFNPFVWILSRWIGLEREARCDRAASARVDVDTYAQVLLDLSRRGSSASAARFAATGDGRGSSLGERLRRLLQPGARPGMGVSLKILPLALLLTISAIFVGRQAMGVTVEALSQQEWMQRIQTALAMVDPEHPPADWKQGDKMRLVGKITDSEGRTIPGSQVSIRLQFDDSPVEMGASALVDESTGAFERELELTDWPSHRPYDTVTLMAVAPGYNAGKKERVPTRKGDISFDFRLEKGAPVEVVILDESGEPVPEAEVTLRVWVKLQHLTVQGGRASLRVPAEQDLIFEVEAEGYRDARSIRRRFTQDGGRLEVVMKKGPPIRGFVYDAETGKPIEGAGVFRVSSVSLSGDASRGQSYWVGQDDPLVRTKADGSFAIYTLEEDWLHWLVIEKDGYLAGFSGEGDSRGNRRFDAVSFAVTPGNQPIKVRLIPQAELEVTLLLPDGWPMEGETEGKIHYSHSYITGLRSGPSSSEGSRLFRKKVKVEDGRLRFTLRPTMAAPLSIGLNDSGDPREIVEGWTFDKPVVLDFSAKSAVTASTVDYVIRFHLPGDAPAPEGRLDVNYVDGSYVSRHTWVPIIDGEAHFSIDQRFDRKVTFDSAGVVGYHFPSVRIPPPDAPPTEPVERIIENPMAAGALSVELQNMDAEAETQVSVDRLPAFWQVWKQPYALWSGHGSFRLPPGETKLLLTPIPFGTPLRLTVRHGNLLFEAEPEVLREEKPLDNVILRLPDGSPLTGQVLDPGGDPVADTQVYLNLVVFNSKRSYSTYSFGTRTDTEGHFRFERVNFDVDRIFYLSVNNVDGTADLKKIINPEETEGSMTLRLLRAADLEVRVIDAATGAPMSGLRIECRLPDLPEDRRFLGDTKVAPLATDAKGWTRFVNLPLKGVYTFRVLVPISSDSVTGFNVTRDLPPLENGKRSIVIEVTR